MQNSIVYVVHLRNIVNIIFLYFKKVSNAYVYKERFINQYHIEYIDIK